METILQEIKGERKRQDEKWGQQNHAPIEWVAILTEEVGEVAKEALDFHFKNDLEELNPLSKYQIQQERLLKYRKELIQVAAVSVAMIESLDSYLKTIE